MSKAGRPSKYTPEFLEKVRDYIREEYRHQDEVVPSIPGLARYAGVSSSSLFEWRKKHEELDSLLSDLLDTQHVVALNKGLCGEFNAAITKLLLHNHGYSDKQSSEISGPNGQPIKTQNEWVIQPVRANTDRDS